MQLDLNALLKTASTLVDALQGSEDITIRHAGMVVKAPYAGNEQNTIAQIIAAFGGKIGIPAGVTPNVTRPGEGAIPVGEKVTPGVYDAFTDKKENASS